MARRAVRVGALLAILLMPASGYAQSDAYRVPRTEHGHPDFQGVWGTAFLTPLERPDGVTDLIVSPAQAEKLVAAIRKKRPAVTDPDVQLDDIRTLAKVKGAFRTSVIVDPPDGQMPFTQAGSELANKVIARDEGQFDDPEQRPLAERCLENMGYAPIRALAVFLPRQIVQTRDYVLIMAEDTIGLRLIHLRDTPHPAVLRSVEGYSRGRWDRDTLVVETTQFLTDDPARSVAGRRPLLLSPRTKITEWFTRVSATELFYRLTVVDDELYSRPFSGEFSLTWHDGPTYEYACHEANYSLPNILRGGQK